MEAGTIPPPIAASIVNDNSGTKTGGSIAPSIFIISAVVAIVVISIILIPRLIRFFAGDSHGSSYHFSISRTNGNATGANTIGLSEHEKAKLIDSLPLFTLASSMAKLPKSSLDCAVCCEPFLPDAELRLLPACRHAFHRSCVDVWLITNPSCPLCRSSITLPYAPLPDLSSGSFRLELGNVSCRRSEPAESQVQNQIRPAMPPLRTYSLDSYEYFIEEEVEIVQPPVTKPEKREIRELSDLAPQRSTRPPRPPPPPPPRPPLVQPPPAPLPPPLPPIESQPSIESLTREKPVRAWLQEYLDGIASSASSSFNSMRFPSQRWSGRWSGRWSQRSSQRFDTGGGDGVPPETWLWDLEAGQSEEAGGLLAVYRWLTGL